MPKATRTERFAIAANAAIIAILAVIGLWPQQSVQVLKGLDAHRSEIVAQLLELRSLRLLLEVAESGQRGFLLTGRATYL
jgi:CHASE3 domain sensor protein